MSEMQHEPDKPGKSLTAILRKADHSAEKQKEQTQFVFALSAFYALKKVIGINILVGRPTTVISRRMGQSPVSRASVERV